jgi:hypothetical protein
MTAITIADLNTAKQDVDHIAEVSTSTGLTATDRLGHTKDTVAGAIAKIAAIVNRGAWAPATVYASKDVVQVAGTWYICIVPHTSSAAFATDLPTKWRVYQGVIAADLAAAGGSALVGYGRGKPGTVLHNLAQVMTGTVSLFEYMTDAQIADVQAYDPFSIPVRNPLIDCTAAIQKAVDENYRVYVPNGGYLITSPIRLRSRAQLVGESPSVDHGAVFFASTGVVWAANRGVIETKNFSWIAGGGEGAKPDFWFWGLLENIAVQCNSVVDYGIVIWCVGEESRLYRCDARYAKKANIFMGGEMAVGHLDNCSGWYSATGVGLLMDDHPNPSFAPAITPQDGGRGNGGSIRLIGFSGDHNVLGHIKATGSQIVEVVGLKSEFNTPCITIGGSGQANNRQRWNITGYRFASDVSGANRDLVQITGTARPQVVIGAGACYNATNVINDIANSITVVKQAEGFPTFYDLDYEVHLRTRASRMPGVVTFQSDRLIDNPSFTMAHPTVAAIRYKITAQNVGTDQVKFEVGSTPNKIFSVDAASNGDLFKLYSFNGTGMEAIVKMFNSAGLACLQLGQLTTQKIGFYGAAGVAKPAVTGSRAGNAALASLLTQLANLGLLTDSSTA